MKKEVQVQMENLRSLSIQIRNDQFKKLKEMSKPGVSISQLIRTAIDAIQKPLSPSVSFQKSSYSEYESNSIINLKQIHALTTLKKCELITEQEYINIKDRLDLR